MKTFVPEHSHLCKKMFTEDEQKSEIFTGKTDLIGLFGTNSNSNTDICDDGAEDPRSRIVNDCRCGCRAAYEIRALRHNSVHIDGVSAHRSFSPDAVVELLKIYRCMESTMDKLSRCRARGHLRTDWPSISGMIADTLTHRLTLRWLASRQRHQKQIRQRLWMLALEITMLHIYHPVRGRPVKAKPIEAMLYVLCSKLMKSQQDIAWLYQMADGQFLRDLLIPSPHAFPETDASHRGRATRTYLLFKFQEWQVMKSGFLGISWTLVRAIRRIPGGNRFMRSLPDPETRTIWRRAVRLVRLADGGEERRSLHKSLWLYNTNGSECRVCRSKKPCRLGSPVSPRQKWYLCSGCMLVHYCSRRCQKWDWSRNGHRRVCQDNRRWATDICG